MSVTGGHKPKGGISEKQEAARPKASMAAAGTHEKRESDAAATALPPGSRTRLQKKKQAPVDPDSQELLVLEVTFKFVSLEEGPL